MKHSKATYAIGIGAGLVGAFFVFHQINKWWAQRKLNELRAKAVSGEVSTRTFLEAALQSGAQADPNAPRVTIQEAQRMSCSTIFPPSMANAFPGFNEALAELRRNGTCL